MGRHSNDKPAEPEKKVEPDEEVPKPAPRKPMAPTSERPSFDTPLKLLEPNVNAAFKKQIDSLDTKKASVVSDGSIAIGTSCKRGGCNGSYDGPASNNSMCVHHPGIPVFHEGMKYWSCCKKKTSDFSAFLAQVGCETGKHKWIQDQKEEVSCRWDWHQTASNVVVAVYAKSYDYKTSFVKLSPVRLVVKLVFPQQNSSEFNIDLELRGVVNVEKASASMYGTKVEITMPKAEGIHWSKLDFPRDDPIPENEQVYAKNSVAAKVEQTEPAEEEDDESDVDLDDIEPVTGAKITELGELARTCQLVDDVAN